MDNDKSRLHLSVFCPIEICTWNTSQGRFEIESQILNAADPREAARLGPRGRIFNTLSDETLYQRRRVGLGTAHRDHRLSVEPWSSHGPGVPS